MQEYGLAANAEVAAVKSPPCQVCDDPRPVYAWTDYSGEAICLKCGTSYQLKWGELKEGETYPRINVKKAAIPMLRRYFAETGKRNGCGTIMSLREYPEIHQGQCDFAAWWREHKQEYPELQPKEDPQPADTVTAG